MVLARLEATGPDQDLPTVAATVWRWLAADEHRALRTTAAVQRHLQTGGPRSVRE
jgi:hypothetical protein